MLYYLYWMTGKDTNRANIHSYKDLGPLAPSGQFGSERSGEQIRSFSFWLGADA